MKPNFKISRTLALAAALLLVGHTGAWAQNMTTVEITVSFQGMSNGNLYSYVIASGSHEYRKNQQSGAYASFSSNTDYDIGTQFGAYELPLNMTLNGNLSFVSESSNSDAVVRNGDFTLSFTSPKYILRAIVTTGAKADTIAGNKTSSLTVSLPVNTQFKNVKLQVTFADYATLDDFSSLGNNTYAISSKEDLAKLAGIVNVQGNPCSGKTFRQTCAIVCDDTYSPIGDSDHSFSGTYDGQNYTISGITANRAGRDIGLFGCVRGGSILNVVLTHSSFSGNYQVGGIVGSLYYGSVQNCRVLDVTVSASGTGGSDFGAIVGFFDNADYLQNNYYRGCTVCGKTTQVGCGFRGYSADIDGARSLHTVTPINVSVSGGETVAVGNQTYYASGVPMTVSYNGYVNDCQIPQFHYNDGTDHLITGHTFDMPAADITLSATLISAQRQITAQPADGHFWTTFYDGQWRYQLPQGATAYTMGYDYHLYRLGDDGRTIPAGTAVVIISDRAGIPLIRTNEVSPVDLHSGTNALLGSDNPVALTGGKLGGKEVYVMGIVNNQLGFYPYTGTAIPAGKAFYKKDQIVDLADLYGEYTAQHGDILTGTPGRFCQIMIADNASVTLYNAHITSDYSAGITCLGNATLFIVGDNGVTGGKGYAGIRCGGSGTTLTIRGTGSLIVQGEGDNGSHNIYGGAGIGGDKGLLSCGDIRIEGGTIVAHGGDGAAGIGCGVSTGHNSSCGPIYISGGTITALGGAFAAGIGCGYSFKYTVNGGISNSACGNITVTKSVKSITSYTRLSAPYSIGKGHNAGASQQCGTITIGGVDYGTDGIETSPFIYAP